MTGLPLFRDATWRLVALNFVLVSLATLVILGFVYWKAGGVIDAQQRQVIEAELRGLADDYLQGGTLALERAIDRRRAGPEGKNVVFLLADASGRRIAGNLASWPPSVEPGQGWVTLELYAVGADTPTTVSAVTVPLINGERLLVGRDVAARAAFDRTLARSLGWALVAMLAVAVGMGWLLTRLILQRIDEIGSTAQSIMDGTLDRRIALTGTGDEFDRLAQTLNAMLDRIGALVGDLRMVTDSLAHDLRAPLGRLSRHLESALGRDLSVEEREDRITSAKVAAERVLAIATALLDISRIDAGIAADQFEPIDLASIARDASELYVAVAEEQGIRIEMSAEPGLMIFGHPQLIARAVTNLLDNALRYAPVDSTVLVAARRGDRGPEISVADNGPGILPGDRERAVKRFIRLDPSRGGEGSGLGLALVQSVARLHKAELVLSDNSPGLVATLRFAPLAEEVPA